MSQVDIVHDMKRTIYKDGYHGYTFKITKLDHD